MEWFFIMEKIQLWQVRQYVKAIQESHLDDSHRISAMKAELAEIKGDVVYFRNYVDTNLEYIEFCFTRLVGKVKFNYIAYVEYSEDSL